MRNEGPKGRVRKWEGETVSMACKSGVQREWDRTMKYDDIGGLTSPQVV
jgi:hypothetical protein